VGALSPVSPGGNATADFLIRPVRLVPYDDTLLNYYGVDLSVSGLPDGATAILSPFSKFPASTFQANDRRTGTLTVMTSKSTPPGTYPITIAGVIDPVYGNGPSHSTTVPLIVNPTDFTVSAAPLFQTIATGGIATYTATINVSSGLYGEVIPSVANLPAGVSATFDPPTVNGSGASTLTLTTNSLTPVGLYRLMIAGTNGSSSDSDNVALAVQSPCLTSNDSRQDTVIASQSGAFSAQFDDIPSTALINSIVGLSAGSSGFTAMVRFNPSGTIDVYDGNSHSFAAKVKYAYSGGQIYHFRLDLDVVSNTYSAYVTPASGSEQQIASNYRFRYKTAAIDHWSVYAGPATVCDFSVQSGGLKISAVQYSQGVTAGGTAMYGLSNFSSDEAALLSVYGLPQGVTTSFSSNPIPGFTLVPFLGALVENAGSSSMAITTSAATPPGNYPLTVVGTNGDHIGFVDLTLVVTAP
jgi:hypothetical protein